MGKDRADMVAKVGAILTDWDSGCGDDPDELTEMAGDIIAHYDDDGYALAKMLEEDHPWVGSVIRCVLKILGWAFVAGLALGLFTVTKSRWNGNVRDDLFCVMRKYLLLFISALRKLYT